MNINENLNEIVNLVKSIVSVKEVYLFGSYAYGEPNEESDYDIYCFGRTRR